MLAQNFKTPTDLGITDAEHDALRKVLGMLERGEIKSHQFSMKEWGDCGTVHCIGGWASTILKNNRLSDISAPWRRTALSDLFYPRCYRVRGEYVDGYTATVDQAAVALRNFLTQGEPRWEEAIAA